MSLNTAPEQRRAEHVLTQDAGFDHHLVKPVDVDQVRKILASVAQKAEKAA